MPPPARVCPPGRPAGARDACTPCAPPGPAVPPGRSGEGGKGCLSLPARLTYRTVCYRMLNDVLLTRETHMWR